MAVILEIKGGMFASRKVPVRMGETVSIGRAPDRAQFAVPHDNNMSGVHFAVECGPSGCRVIDKKSTNGTFLNGGQIQEAMLASGDEIKSGQTVFVARIVPDDQLPATLPSPQAAASSPAAAAKQAPAPAPAPHRPPAVSPPPEVHAQPAFPSPLGLSDRPAQPAASAPAPRSQAPPARPAQPPILSIGGWAFSKIPQGWQIQEGLGIQLDAKDAFPSNIVAMEEPLGPGITLQQYVEAQTKMFREYLRQPEIGAALPPAIPGAADAVALEVRYKTKEGQSIYYQRVYARSASTIGVLTLTTLESELASVRPALDSLLSGVTFSPKA